MVIIESTGGHTLRVQPLRREDAQEARAAIEERMKLAHSTAAAVSANTSTIATQIRELAELRDTGIITEAEFENKKKGLLDRM